MPRLTYHLSSLQYVCMYLYNYYFSETIIFKTYFSQDYERKFKIDQIKRFVLRNGQQGRLLADKGTNWLYVRTYVCMYSMYVCMYKSKD